MFQKITTTTLLLATVALSAPVAPPAVVAPPAHTEPRAANADSCAVEMHATCSAALGEASLIKVLKCAHGLLDSDTGTTPGCKAQIQGSIADSCLADIETWCTGDLKSFTDFQKCAKKHHRSFSGACHDAIKGVKSRAMAHHQGQKGNGKKGKGRGKGGEGKEEHQRGGHRREEEQTPEADAPAQARQATEPDVPLSNSEMFEFVWGGEVKGIELMADHHSEKGGHGRMHVPLPAIIGGSVGLLLIVSLVACCCVRRRRRKAREAAEHNLSLTHDPELGFSSVLQPRPQHKHTSSNGALYYPVAEPAQNTLQYEYEGVPAHSIPMATVVSTQTIPMAIAVKA